MIWNSSKYPLTYKRKFAYIPTLVDDRQKYVWLTYYYVKFRPAVGLAQSRTIKVSEKAYVVNVIMAEELKL